jgi:murein DD-endopeptidase MepM/ murein hydrolase activator NlpD
MIRASDETVSSDGKGRAAKRVAIATISLLTLCVLCAAGAGLSQLGGLFNERQSDYTFSCGNGRKVDPDASLPSVAELTEGQMRNAAIIVMIGQELKIAPRGWVIGVATALQESRLTNLPDLGPRNDHDSIGLFQQRPSQGWGTPEQLSDPEFQARKFFQKLQRIANWQSLPLTVAAQRVQISAYPDAYAKHEPLASRVVDALTGGASRAAGTAVGLRCASAGEITASGWTVPVQGPIVSGFRTPQRPHHNGVDIAVAKGTPIRAAAAGVVITVLCNAHLGAQRYTCDRDGGVNVLGCGWYVDILHAGAVITRYCHQMIRPFVIVGQSVAAGDIIGLSGSSGHSSGPHVHFEVHVNGDRGPLGAIDPVPFMKQVGAPLLGGG